MDDLTVSGAPSASAAFSRRGSGSIAACRACKSLETSSCSSADVDADMDEDGDFRS